MEKIRIDDLAISPESKRSLADMGIEICTSIQAQSIPLLLEGKDLIGQSHTGTGKTAAFALPILEKIDPDNKKPQALILCPTRELAVQVSKEFKRMTKYRESIRVVAVYGGEPINRQITNLKKGAQVIIGTPGRTIDHITRRRTIKTADIRTLVLDEADEMLNMGFREDIECILETLPQERQTIFFSATMPRPILRLTKKYQKDPVFIQVENKEKTADTITQEYCQTSPKHKPEALLRLLATEKPSRCIVFCNMKSTVDRITEELTSQQIFAEKIHGDLKQEQRMAVLKMFNRGDVSVLVATDVAARGLDIQNVDLIINYDLPDKEEYYVHRIGRSGRAGQEGRSITLITPREERSLSNIMRYTNKKVDKILIPTNLEVEESRISQMKEEVFSLADSDDLDSYKALIASWSVEIDPQDLASALLKMTMTLEKSKTTNDINLAPSHKGRQDKGARKDKGKNKKRRAGKKNTSRLFINVGKKDNVQAKDLAKSICKECQLRQEAVGNIDVLNAFSFVDVDTSSSKTVLKKMQGKKIKGKRIHVEKATP